MLKRPTLCLLTCLCVLAVCIVSPVMAEEIKITLPENPLTQSLLLRLRLQSSIMGFPVPVIVYLPKGYGGREACPVWYALHSYSSSETMWVDDEHIDQIADQLIADKKIPPLVMVFPFVRYDSAKVIVTDMQDGIRSESQSNRFLCEELIPYIDATFQTEAVAKARSISGFSMGGLFALEIGLRHPELFSRIGAFSPALKKKEYSVASLSDWLFPGEALPTPDNWLSVHHLQATSIYLDCGGTSDPFSQGIASLASLLQQLGIKLEYSPHQGGHSLRQDRLKTYLTFSAAFESVIP